MGNRACSRCGEPLSGKRRAYCSVDCRRAYGNFCRAAMPTVLEILQTYAETDALNKRSTTNFLSACDITTGAAPIRRDVQRTLNVIEGGNRRIGSADWDEAEREKTNLAAGSEDRVRLADALMGDISVLLKETEMISAEREAVMTRRGSLEARLANLKRQYGMVEEG